MWKPDPDRVAQANMTAFRKHVNNRHGLDLADYKQLYDWSVNEPAEFWHDVAEYAGVIFRRPPDRMFTPGPTMRESRFFTGATLNFAENLLRRRDDHSAIVFRNEAGHRAQWSYHELYGEVSRVAQGLRGLGVESGDRVAGFLPNMPHTVIAMLATSALGAIWSSCSPDFGVRGVLDRFGQIEPKVLLTADGYFYNGKQIDSLHRAHDFLAELDSVERVIVVPHVSERPDLAELEGAVAYEQFVSGHRPREIEFAELPFDHPLYIMYSSGTTGLPKSIVHGQGRTLVQHVKELALHTDLGPGDTILYFTTCGWMMWNWLVSSLVLGATVVLYDGAPFHPDGHTLWSVAEEEGITVFGTSAKYLSAVEKAGVRPGDEHDLSELKSVLSTGSPLMPEQYDWVYDAVKRDLQLSSISGGTDIVSCFALGNPVAPVYRGELQARGLGMAVHVFDDEGNPVRGERGELVCTEPFPAMPVSFWNDPDGERYRRAYFDRFEDVWTHGDFAILTEHDGLIILGRSDAVLNPGGVRIGTAEIYRIVENMDEVVEAICVGQDWEGDVRVVLFLRLRDGVVLEDELRGRIRDEIRAEATPRHVPAKIIQVADIPRTISGKITELAVRDIVHGREVENRDALANPDALDLYRDLQELKS
ncbi:MAG: Acetyl-coenzyme A synthetase [Calditrichaeota bacterium]|nr:Acetyl-coenzyme A synthetase [Calditrichota bacterium]